jgi:hypothetical protein
MDAPENEINASGCIPNQAHCMLFAPCSRSHMKQLEVISLYEQFKAEHGHPPTRLKITRDDWTRALNPNVPVTDMRGDCFFMGMQVEFSPLGSPQVS